MKHQLDKSRYVVIADNHSWGAAESLCEALSNAHLREDTRLSHFDEIIDKNELQERWDDWKEFGKYDFDRGDDPTECVIFWLDHEIWESWEVSPINGSLRVVPKDSEMSARKKLEEIRIKALFDNGVLKPIK